MDTYLLLDMHWHHYTAQYRTPGAAWDAWLKLEELMSDKSLNMGIFRHGPQDDPGVLVTVLSTAPQGVLRSRRILRADGGIDHHLADDVIHALIARRIRFLAFEAPPGAEGHMTIKHPGIGREILPDGSYREVDTGD